MSAKRLENLARSIVPRPVRSWLREQQQRRRLVWPRAGSVNFGDLRRLTPVSTSFGRDRGLPIDRYYIEQLLAAHASDIRGRVLEMGDAFYTKKFGGDRVQQSDVLHVVPGNPAATIVADLTCADQIPTGIFDCIILTQTIQMIYDARAALRHLHRILKPAGVLLATAHGITKIARREGVDDWGEYWHFTSQSFKRFFAEEFPSVNVEVRAYGNVLSAVAFLHGLATDELTPRELDAADPQYEVLLTARVAKAKNQ